eukprot:UC1_evm1s908
MSGSLAQTLRGKGRVVLPDAGKVGGVDGVTVDALVVLKILKHARENPHEAVMGPLLGLVVGRNLEVTNCFPFPRSTEEETEESRAQDMQYQFEMMRCLREVNVDHLQVGLYHSARMGAYFSEELVQTQYEHQTEIEESVVLIYDPEQVEQGQLSIKAFRLTDRFIKTFKGGDFSVAGLKKSGLTYDGIFEEVAVTLKTSHLGLAAIDTMKASGDETQLFDSLDLSTN